MILTAEETAILLELYRYVEKPNSIGEKYTVVGVPSGIFHKLILGLGSNNMSPRQWIEKRKSELIAGWESKNEGKQKSIIFNVAVENQAIVDYLEHIYKRGGLPTT